MSHTHKSHIMLLQDRITDLGYDGYRPLKKCTQSIKMNQNTQILIGVVVIGAAIWYFNKDDKPEDKRR